jgi:hypothetical protein
VVFVIAINYVRIVRNARRDEAMDLIFWGIVTHQYIHGEFFLCDQPTFFQLHCVVVVHVSIVVIHSGDGTRMSSLLV